MNRIHMSFPMTPPPIPPNFMGGPMRPGADGMRPPMMMPPGTPGMPVPGPFPGPGIPGAGFPMPAFRGLAPVPRMAPSGTTLPTPAVISAPPTTIPGTLPPPSALAINGAVKENSQNYFTRNYVPRTVPNMGRNPMPSVINQQPQQASSQFSHTVQMVQPYQIHPMAPIIVNSPLAAQMYQQRHYTPAQYSIINPNHHQNFFYSGFMNNYSNAPPPSANGYYQSHQMPSYNAMPSQMPQMPPAAQTQQQPANKRIPIIDPNTGKNILEGVNDDTGPPKENENSDPNICVQFVTQVAVALASGKEPSVKEASPIEHPRIVQPPIESNLNVEESKIKPTNGGDPEPAISSIKLQEKPPPSENAFNCELCEKTFLDLDAYFCHINDGCDILKDEDEVIWNSQSPMTNKYPVSEEKSFLSSDADEDEDDLSDLYDALNCELCEKTFHDLDTYFLHISDGCEDDNEDEVICNSQSKRKSCCKDYEEIKSSHKKISDLLQEQEDKHRHYKKKNIHKDIKLEEPPLCEESLFYCYSCKKNCLAIKDCEECYICLKKKEGSILFKNKPCLLRQFIEKNDAPMCEKKILRKRIIKGQVEYLLKCKGYPNYQNSWKDQKDICNKALILQFEKNQKLDKESCLPVKRTRSDSSNLSSAKRRRKSSETLGSENRAED